MFEAGVLRPLEPLPLAEHAVVSLLIDEQRDAYGAQSGDAYVPRIVQELGANVSRERAREILAKLPMTLTEAFDVERAERF